jgi:hypothetical protein
MGVTLGLALLAVPGLAAAVCGDGLPDMGEQCDPGPDVADDCCTAGCTITSATPAFVCRPVADLCDVAETCDGVSATCPADSAAGAFVECRPGGDECDPAENCDGVSTACPADQTEPDGTACDSGDVCDVADTCVGGVCAASSPDGDGDTVCDASDNCPGTPNTNQADLDGDSVGDVCDGDDGPLNPTKIQLRLNNAPSPRDNSVLKAKGDFVTIAVGDVFNASAPISLEIGDGKPVPTTRTATWLPAHCKTTVSGHKCLSPDRTAKATFKTSARAPGVWKFKASLKKTNLTGSLLPPAFATLTYGPGIDRTGAVSDCKQSLANDTGLTCRDAS